MPASPVLFGLLGGSAMSIAVVLGGIHRVGLVDSLEEGTRSDC